MQKSTLDESRFMSADVSPPQKVLFSLGGSFLYYADRFKIYSAFCASHTKVPKVLAKGILLAAIWALLLPWGLVAGLSGLVKVLSSLFLSRAALQFCFL